MTADDRDDRVETHGGWRYVLRVRELPGRGFTAQAEILEDPAGNLVGQVVGSADVVLDTSGQAEEASRRLARRWVEEQGRAGARENQSQEG